MKASEKAIELYIQARDTAGGALARLVAERGGSATLSMPYLLRDGRGGVRTVVEGVRHDPEGAGDYGLVFTVCGIDGAYPEDIDCDALDNTALDMAQILERLEADDA